MADGREDTPKDAESVDRLKRWAMCDLTNPGTGLSPGWFTCSQDTYKNRAFKGPITAADPMMEEVMDGRRPFVDIDPGIIDVVRALQAGGVETFESCQGGEGHGLPEPTVRFHGGKDAGWAALSVAQANGLPVLALRRAWPILDGEPTGPWWEMTFHATDQ